MERRTTLMVASDILTETKEPIGKTKIVYRCNLNFNIIKRWIPTLINKGLLEEFDNPPTKWRTTEKGSSFLYFMEKVVCLWKNGSTDLEDKQMEVVETGVFHSQL